AVAQAHRLHFAVGRPWPQQEIPSRHSGAGLRTQQPLRRIQRIRLHRSGSPLAGAECPRAESDKILHNAPATQRSPYRASGSGTAVTRAAMLSPRISHLIPLATGTALIVAAAYQLTPVKSPACGIAAIR